MHVVLVYEGHHIHFTFRYDAHFYSLKAFPGRGNPYNYYFTPQAELEGLGYQSALGHSALLEGAREVSEIQGQLAPLKAQLVSYKDLPPVSVRTFQQAYRKILQMLCLNPKFWLGSSFFGLGFGRN